jgi:hypothetical protein
LTIIPNTTLLLFVVPLLHHDGLEWVVEWNTCHIHCHWKG